MANMTFGVNIIPKDNTVSLGNSTHPWNITSPNLTGVPVAPTAAAGTNTTQVATTAFVSTATARKADKVSSATNNNFAALDANGNLKDSGKTSASFVASNQGSQNAGKALGIANDGSVTPVPFSGEDFTGATASTAGTHGYVPAPSAGNQEHFLKGDGTWADPPGGKLFVVDLDTVTNTSGSYTHTTSISGVTADMKPVKIELSNSKAFLSTVNITTTDGSITLTCSSVKGTSTVKVSLMFIATSDSLTSSEFDVLAGRIGTLSSLTTSAKTDTVAAINEVNANVGTLSSLHTTAKTSLVAATNEISEQIGTLNGKMPDVPQIGKLLRNDAISTSDTSIAIADLSKYNVFQAYIASSFQGGPCIGMRVSATSIIFFGATLASGGSLTYTLAQMKTNGDSFAGWDTAGTYGTKWGGNVNGISKIYGIA